MSELPQQAYPEREDYDFPTTPEQQIWETVTMYPDRKECEMFLRGLDGMYKNENFVRTMKVLSEAAVDIRASITPTQPDKSNNPFYEGILFSTHVNLWPINDSPEAKRLLRTYGASKSLTKERMMDSIVHWIDEDPDSYLDIISQHDSSMHFGVGIFAERLYPVDIEDRSDFLAGFCITKQTIGLEIPSC